MNERKLPIPIGQKVELPGHFDVPVVIEAIRPLGSGYECRVRLPDGSLEEAVLSEEEVSTLAWPEPIAQPTIRLVDPEKARLLIESARIRLAYAHDRQFAVSLSGIRTLPHQIEAVYQRMLPQPRLRFLLADDPGAGKTIMAGLLVKELERATIEAILQMKVEHLAGFRRQKKHTSCSAAAITRSETFSALCRGQVGIRAATSGCHPRLCRRILRLPALRHSSMSDTVLGRFPEPKGMNPAS